MKRKEDISYKIVNIISGTNKSLAFELIANGLKKESSIDISYILLQQKESEFSQFLREANIPYQIVQLNGKRSYLKCLLSIYKILIKTKPNLVHTHLRDASLIGLTAARIANVKNRVHTRHHSTLNHEYYPKSVKWDKYINTTSTSIISISKIVTSTLIKKEGENENKIELIHHGFDIKKFRTPDTEEVKKLKEKYNIKNSDFPIIGVISRYVHLKGLQYIIPAFSELKKEYPNAHLILANAVGSDSEEVKKTLKKHLKEIDYTEIAFENDLYNLYALFDYFVHAPINKDVEAFGQTYIEALCAGIPSVFTVSGIANEFITHNKNALIVPYCSSKSITKELKKLINNNDLCLSLSKQGIEDTKQFSEQKYVEQHVNLYNKLCHQKGKK